MHQFLIPLIDRSLIRSYNSGATIIHQGEAPRYACIIKDGTIRVINITPQGEEQIIMYHVKGEFFPSSWLYGKAPVSLFFYEAIKPTEIAFVKKEELLDYMMSSPERMNAMLDYFTTNYSASLIQVSALEQSKARDKLLYILFFLCHRYGKKSIGGTILIPLALTHQNIASLVGLTRETTANEISKLKRKKILSYKNQLYSINQKKLLEAIGEDSLRDINISV